MDHFAYIPIHPKGIQWGLKLEIMKSELSQNCCEKKVYEVSLLLPFFNLKKMESSWLYFSTAFKFTDMHCICAV